MDKSMEKKEKKAIKVVAKKKVKKVLQKSGFGALHRSALMMSPYLHSLLDAVNYPGVKIPDSVTTPSYAAQVLTKFVVTTTTTATDTGAGFYRTLGNTTSGAGSGFASLAPTTATGTGAPFYAPTGQPLPWATQLPTLAASMRLVSAKISVQYLGSPNNAQGRLVIAFLPPNSTFQGQAGSGVFQTVGLPSLLQQQLVADVPASKLYAEARYVPIDPIALSYEQSGSIAVGTLRGAAQGTASLQASYGAFAFIGTGLPVGQSLEVNVWENYECIPLSNLTSLAQPSPSFSDPLEMAAVSNVVAAVPQIPVMQSSDQLLASAQSSGSILSTGATSVTSASPRVSRHEGPSFSDALFSGANKALDVVAKGLPLVGAIAAML